jgi:hypothetical protein
MSTFCGPALLSRWLVCPSSRCAPRCRPGTPEGARDDRVEGLRPVQVSPTCEEEGLVLEATTVAAAPDAIRLCLGCGTDHTDTALVACEGGAYLGVGGHRPR